MNHAATLMERLRDEDGAAADYLVLADFLTEREDLRGELIRVQHALSQAPDAALQARQAALLEAHLETLAGFVPGRNVELTWRWGFVDQVVVGQEASDEERRAALDAITTRDGCALVRHLTLGIPGRFQSNKLSELFTALAREGRVARSLRSLRLGTAYEDNPYRRVYDNFERFDADDDLSLAWGLFPALETLLLDPGYTADLSLGTPVLPRLRSFEWISPFLRDVEPICALDAPALERVVVWTGKYRSVNWTYEADAPGFDEVRGRAITGYAQLQPLFEHLETLPALHTFGLLNFDGSWGALAPRLSEHAVFSRISTLEMSRGRLEADEVEPLVAALRRMPGLRCLRADGLYANPAVWKRLRDGLGGVALEGTRSTAPSQFYYVSAQE
jgi:uncharacterized protein (TIGR02996 family)